MARRTFYGSLEVRVGTPADALPPLQETEIERAAVATREGMPDLAHLPLEMRRAFQVGTILILAQHLAANRHLRASRVQIGKADILARMSVEEIEADGGLTVERKELLRLRREGLLNAPIYLPLGEHFLSVVPCTPSGAEHDELTVLSAWRLHSALKRIGVRGRRLEGDSADRVATRLLNGVLVEPLEGEWLRQRVSIFRNQLEIERVRRLPLFQLPAEELLRAPVPNDPLEDALDPDSTLRPRLPLHCSIPGMTDTRGHLQAPSAGATAAPFEFYGSYAHVPAIFVPAIEAHANSRT